MNENTLKGLNSCSALLSVVLPSGDLEMLVALLFRTCSILTLAASLDSGGFPAFNFICEFYVCEVLAPLEILSYFWAKNYEFA